MDTHGGGLIQGAREFARSDRASMVAVVVASAAYAALWWSKGAVVSGDTFDYQAAASALLHGSDVIPDRVPGYPLLLALTGAVDAPSHALVVAQLALHAAAVLLVVAVARHLGVGPRLRLAVTAALLLPPVVARSLYMLSEGLAEFLVVVTVWRYVRWYSTRRVLDLVLLGLAAGVCAWVRPTFTALFVVVGMAVWGAARSTRSDGSGWSPARQAALSAALTLGVVSVLVLANVVRYDYPTTTPLLGWNLSTRTSSYVEEMTGDPEVRRLLVEARDRSLVEGESHTGVVYIWPLRQQLAATTGLTGRELDQYMLRLNLGLIASNPLDYLLAVTTAAGGYVLLYSPAEADFGARPLVLLWLSIHLLLALAFVAQSCVTAGLLVLRRVPDAVLWPLVFCYSLLLYNLAISTMFEVGNPRHRTPTDAVALLVLAVGLTLWNAARRDATPPTSPSATAREALINPASADAPITTQDHRQGPTW